MRSPEVLFKMQTSEPHMQRNRFRGSWASLSAKHPQLTSGRWSLELRYSLKSVGLVGGEVRHRSDIAADRDGAIYEWSLHIAVEVQSQERAHSQPLWLEGIWVGAEKMGGILMVWNEEGTSGWRSGMDRALKPGMFIHWWGVFTEARERSLRGDLMKSLPA